MKHLMTSLLIIMLAVIAFGSRFFIEDPPYPVSAIHAPLVFISGLFAWICLTLAGIRRAYAFYVCGLSFMFIALVTAIFPDLWLRWPEATLAGLALVQLGAYFTPRRNIISSPRLFVMAFIISVVALLPLAATPYFPWAVSARPVMAAAGLIIFITGVILAWAARQRKINPIPIVTLIATLSFVTCLTLIAFGWLITDVSSRQVLEYALFCVLLFIGAIYSIDQVTSEKSLRSGPHLSLESSMRDALTSLANRRALETYGPRLIAQSHEAGRPASVILCDIDHFKQINDIHGHPAGDTVLQKTANALSSQVRKSDLVARYGGEEFIIILPGSPLAPALRLAERMRAAVEEETVKHEDLELRRTASFGVATAFPEEPLSLPELVKRADANLYRAKRDGRNQVKSDELIPEHF